MIYDLFYFLGGLALGAAAFWLFSPSRPGAEEKAEAVPDLPPEPPPPEKKPPVHESPGFRVLFGAFSSGAGVMDGDGCFIEANTALQERLGYTHDEFIGMSYRKFVHPQDFDSIRAFLDCAASREPAASFAGELSCFTKDGGVLWVHLQLSVLPLANPDDTREPPRILALLADVTRRRQAETAAARLTAGVHDLYQVVANQHLQLQEQMQAALSLGCRWFGVETGFLGKLTDDGLEAMAIVSPDERLRVGSVYAVEDPNEPAAAALPIPLASAVANEWSDHPVVAETAVQTFLSAPIYCAGKLFGLLYFSDGEPREEAFGVEQTQFGQLMALWMGSEIERRERRAAQAKEDADLHKANIELEAIATQDALTGVKNRRAFDAHLQGEFNRARLHGMAFSLALLDVDKFKQYNDSFGHPAGDDVLRQVGQLMQNSVREGIFVARYGGEEFVVLMSGVNSTEAQIIADRLRANIEGGDWKHRAITASFGVATWTSDMARPADLVAAADRALYQSKEDGRNRVTAIENVPAPARVTLQ